MLIPASRRVVSVARRLLPLLVVAAGLHAAGPLAAADPLRIHVVRGLWSREYRLEEAVALAGAGIVAESWHAQGMGFGHPGGWDAAAGGSVPEFPDAAEDLLACHVLVICNVNANAFTPSQQRLIEGFVRRGGGLLLLGGRFAFGGQWAASGLADVAPVRCVAQGFDLKGIPQGLVLSAGPDRPDGVGSAFRWNQSPRVFWYHEVEPKKAARVTVAADRGWQNTGLELARGQACTLAARGRVVLGAAGTTTIESEADGISLDWYRGRPLGRLVAAQWVEAPADGGRPRFVVLGDGAAATITAAADGPLYLKVNAPPGGLAARRGTRDVVIEPRR